MPLIRQFAFCLAIAAAATTVASAQTVRTLRLPRGAIQPQAAVDDNGAIDLLYFQGEPQHGDLYFVQWTDGVADFKSPLKVNRNPQSAIAIGNIRGAHLAVGRDNRVHVAWMGSDRAQPKAPGNASPMLYTRLNDAGEEFEPERNVISSNVGLDGGGSLAADREGNVYVAWHAPKLGQKGEENRRVWVAHSRDDGDLFEPEQLAFDEPTGCCGCCGMRAMTDDDGTLLILYRSAEEKVHRDMHLLTSNNQGQTFLGAKIADWPAEACVMSTASLAVGINGPLAAWETEGQVYFGRINPANGRVDKPIAAPGATGKRKHPVLTTNGEGDILLAWTEGMGWNQGGSAAWQVFDSSGRPLPGGRGKAEGVPVWSLVAAAVQPDGDFVVIY